MGPSYLHPADPVRLAVALGWVLGVAVLFGCSGRPAPAKAQALDGGPDYPLFDHSTTWTGEQLIIVGGAGGDMNDGLLVDDPLEWSPEGGFTSIAKPPGPTRNRQAAVWTGEEVLVWSGTSKPFGVGDGILTSSAAYDPAANQWRELAPLPDELAKVEADAGIVGRIALFAAGKAELSERDRLVAVYDLDLDRWDTAVLPGAAIALAADGDRGFVLWQSEGFSDAGTVGVELGQVQVTEDGVLVEPTSLPVGVEKHSGSIGLALVGRTLALLTERGEESAVLHVAELDPSGGLGSWREVVLDNVALRGVALTRKIPIGVVGRKLAVPDLFELYWIDIDQGVAVAETVTSAESCALTGGTTAGVSIGLVAIGGQCTMVDEDGEESHFHGSYLFLPPDG